MNHTSQPLARFKRSLLHNLRKLTQLKKMCMPTFGHLSINTAHRSNVGPILGRLQHRSTVLCLLGLLIPAKAGNAFRNCSALPLSRPPSNAMGSLNAVRMLNLVDKNLVLLST